MVGGDSGTWGGLLNTGAFAQLDLILGATQPITITSADVNVSIPQWNNCAIKLTGALTGNHNLILPFNANSATVAVGGLFVVDNQTTGAFNVTVLTAAAGSTGVKVPQGVRTWLYSDTVNVWYADDSKLQLISWSGNPNGFVAGTQGSVNNPPSMVWDYTNGVLFACVVTGPAATAVWNNIVSAGLPQPTPQGYLTPVSNTPVILSDSISATSIYYTPFEGSWTALFNGLTIAPYLFSQMPLVLSPSQAANNLYDIFMVYNGGAPVIGTGPSWAAGSGGSITAGSCARGTGVGSTDITRNSSGLWVNTNAMSLIYNTGAGNTTISVPAGQATYLGSVFIDSVAGQVTCHRSYGQSRKWGIWNCYNRVPVYLKAGDVTASWTYSTVGVFRPANNNAANSLVIFSGLAEDIYSLNYMSLNSNISGSSVQVCSIGYNNTASPSGFNGAYTSPPQVSNLVGAAIGQYTAPPALGINKITAIEELLVGGTATFYGGEAQNLLTANWRV